MASAKLDQAFIDRFVSQAFGLPIAHENLPFEPTAGTPYVELKVLQNDTTPRSLSDTDQTDGVFRVILRYPVDQGAIAAKQKADNILNAFKVGRRVSYQGVSATVVSHSRREGYAEDGWYKLVVDFRYRAFIKR